MVNRNNQDLNELFKAIQKEMYSSDEVSKTLKHSGDKGDNTESNWIEWFNKYLPTRYAASKATIFDCDGNRSDQIDVVIYDKQYSLTLFKNKNTLYIPAESVYAVFEVKQNLNKKNIKYAKDKAASVRRLKRTSATFIDVDKKKKKRPIKIIAGILTTFSESKNTYCKSILNEIRENDKYNYLDCGCVLDGGSFFYNRTKESMIISENDNALISFYLELIELLQKVGTVAAIDIHKYMKNVGLKEI